VPASAVPGEAASKTQPIPAKPAPFDLQGASDENLIDITPEIKKEAIELANVFDRGGLYTPPTQRGAIVVPGNAGGASWSGAAVDPETSTLYVGTYRIPSLVKIDKPEPWQG
ncbi:pyrroloquinoline quinone-dependent dehydrogenase, partial [Salmonella enterica subsp. enterica serovar Enteritidis]|nr:pyrroloquinoline quinone-dependent dehydrogenase [Salmonella enterica subsp. enterica serovar Enteritidis]